MDKKKVIILGAGISGLATAVWFLREGYDIILLEKTERAGGTITTESGNGYLFDKGPNSGLETTPYIRELAKEAGLEDELIYANNSAQKRYILRDGSLHALPTNPAKFIKSRLFSTRAKFRLLLEPFIGRSEEGYYQSLAEFVTRRLGREFLDYAINPFVSGVFAGTPEKLSVKSAFPKLYRLEEVYGGLFKGMILGAKERKKSAESSKQSAKMFSFRNGMESLARALTEKLEDRIIFNAEITGIKKEESGYRIYYNSENENKEQKTDAIITTIPSYNASGVLGSMDEKLKEHLDTIYYPPVIVLYSAYAMDIIGRPLDGFGFLIPEKEKKAFLGAIWSSVIFPNRAPDGKEAFTLFIGGSRNPDILSKNIETVKETALSEFHEIMGISTAPEYTATKVWEKAIPQYEPGHIEHIRYFEEFEKKYPGIFISGNFREGISIGDCVKASRDTFLKVKNHLS